MNKIYLATIATFIASFVGLAHAAKSTENDAFAIESAKVSMTQAVTTAEQHVGGKATRAEYEKHKGQWVFDVEVVAARKVMDVSIDATSGKVLAAVEDQADNDAEDEKAD